MAPSFSGKFILIVLILAPFAWLYSLPGRGVRWIWKK
jgi:hypothetical protein